MKKTFSILAALSVWANLMLSAQGTQLLRQPTINEENVVFVYADDLWICSRNGGEARRLTTDEGTESVPHFSPDGKLIAFSAQYQGNTDVYVVPAEGGEPRRLTWHPGEDLVQGWMPDGKHVLFRSARNGVPTRINHFFTVGLEGGLPQQLPVPQASFGEISEDGRYLAYMPITFWDPEWRNYRGGQAQPIWIFDLKNQTLQQTPRTDNERHMDPVWFNGKIYFLSERDYASNIWMFDPKTKALEQITFHKDFDVKSLDAGGGRIIYEQGGYLHLLDPATKKARRLQIEVRGDLDGQSPGGMM